MVAMTLDRILCLDEAFKSFLVVFADSRLCLMLYRIPPMIRSAMTLTVQQDF